MTKIVKNDIRERSKEVEGELALRDPLSQKKPQKKAFRPPCVTEHGSLPKVTGQTFVGTFSP
jgi:hypothetical protein